MKAGTIFVTSTGEYSDFGINGFWRALAAFDINAELESFVSNGQAEFPQKRQPWETRYRFEPSDFMQALLRLGLIEQVSVPQFHLGDYGNIPDMPLAPYNGTPVEHPVTWVPSCTEHKDCLEHPELGVLCVRRASQSNSPGQGEK